ncbi:MAG: hypothetical protein GEV08_16040 [Acidimicrobiia bacterium]|nr:hypothetical protein [Acidimicrobiia bacterium]
MATTHRLARVAVFALEDTAVQVVWGDAPVAPLNVTVGPRATHLGGYGRPGGVLVTGLEPTTRYDVVVESGAGDVVRLGCRTLPSPEGELLSTVACLSDLHVGSTRQGWFGTMRDRSGLPEPAPLRCARAALDEAVAWGPDLVVVKGDLTERGRAPEWRAVTPLLQEVAVPLAICPGNHDTLEGRDHEPAEVLGAAGLACAAPVDVVDLPGVRVVIVDSTAPGRSPGTIRRALPDLLDALAEADRPALVCLHHPFEPLPVPTQYPVGIPWPESWRALRKIHRVKRDVVISTGHTHRNRRLHFGHVAQAEVAAVKDYPGVWAGYAVHEGGIRQVVRRVTAPEAMGWTEYTRLTFGGVWRGYAPGLRSHRCYVLRWPGP